MKHIINNVNSFFFKYRMTFLTLIFLVWAMFIIIPHYDDDGLFVFIGKYYDKNYYRVKKKKKDIEEWEEKNVVELTAKILKLRRELEQKDKKHIEVIIDLKYQIDSLQNKLDQQDAFQNNKIKLKTEVDTKKEENSSNKTSFSSVSKNHIKNERPDFGNSFSKAIKKSKIDL